MCYILFWDVALTSTRTKVEVGTKIEDIKNILSHKKVFAYFWKWHAPFHKMRIQEILKKE